MKKLFTFLIVTFSFATGFGCSCENIPSFCEVSKYVAESEVGLIFVGELIAVDTIDQFTWAYQLKIEDKIYGDVIKSDSPYFVDNGYDNTDDLVWILGGQSSLCHREIKDGRSLIACGYESNFGYAAYLCEYNYFHVDDNEMITGFIESNTTTSTIHIDQIRDVIETPCITSVEELDELISTQVQIAPNPFTESINISSSLNLKTEMKYELAAMDGKIITSDILLAGKQTIQTSDLDTGVYFIRFTDGLDSVVRKVVKL